MHLCTLRQGTVLVAVVDLMLSGFLLFILVLGSVHAREMASVLEADIAEAEFVEDPDVDKINELRFHHAHILAVSTLSTLHTIIVCVTIHLVCSISLLCGSVLRNRQLVLPWVVLVPLELILGTTVLISLMWMGGGNLLVYISAAILLQLYMGFFRVVLCYQRALFSESCQRSILTDTILTEFKPGYVKFSTDKAQHV